MEYLIAPMASGIISAIVAAFGVYVAITNRLTKLETLIEELRKDVEKHNHVIERTFKMESDLNTAFKHIDEQRDRIKRLENVKIGGTE
jgi:chromosome segregation ATPase